MRAYEISRFAGATPEYVGDLAAVRQVVRLMPVDVRTQALVTLVETPTDKAAVLELLNGRRPPRDRLRNWTLTRRGRLVEIPLEAED